MIELGILAAIMAVFLLIVRYNVRQGKRHYVQSILQDVEADYNRVEVHPVFHPRDREKDCFEFLVRRGKNRAVSWKMRPKRNEYLVESFCVRGGMLNGDELWLEREVKDRLKDIGIQAYVYWKMGNE